jgi:hypothetical protein
VNLGTYADTVYYRISAVDSSGYGSGYSNEAYPEPPTGIVGKGIAYQLKLYQNMPNPFNPVTTIRYELEKTVHVTLRIYDVEGRIVRQLVDKVQGRGQYSQLWNGRNRSGESVASGIYFYQLKAGREVRTKKMVLLK